MTDDTDDGRLAIEAAAELAHYNTPIELVLRPMSAFHLAALLQLARRHPGLQAESRRLVETFLEHVRQYFAEAPAVRELLRRGDDPAYDVPPLEEPRAKR